MRKKWTRCALKFYWLRNAPTTTVGIPSRHGAANSKFPVSAAPAAVAILFCLLPWLKTPRLAGERGRPLVPHFKMCSGRRRSLNYWPGWLLAELDDRSGLRTRGALDDRLALRLGDGPPRCLRTRAALDDRLALGFRNIVPGA